MRLGIVQNRYCGNVDGGAYWCNLANTIELSMCGSDATFCQLALTTCLAMSSFTLLFLVMSDLVAVCWQTFPTYSKSLPQFVYSLYIFYRANVINDICKPVNVTFQTSLNFLYMLPVDVVGSCSDDSAICCTLPVLWIALCFHIIVQIHGDLPGSTGSGGWSFYHQLPYYWLFSLKCNEILCYWNKVAKINESCNLWNFS